MIDFAGWQLPVEYKSMLKEAGSVRRSCGLFDASHMGEIVVSGPRRLDFLGNLASNDLAQLPQGQMQYNLLLNPRGGIIDDLMIYNLGDKFFCVVNASNKDKVLSWFKVHSIDGVNIVDASSNTALISLQGPDSPQIIEQVFGAGPAGLEYLESSEFTAGDEKILISRSGYTAEDGFEIYLSWEAAPSWWDKLVAAGRAFNLTLCGLGARDILRIEAGYPLYGCEIDEDTNPYEAALAWAVKLNKDCLAKESLMAIKERGVSKKRIGFIMQEKAFPRQGCQVYAGGAITGRVCSGAYSPAIGGFIGMAYLSKDWAVLGSEIAVEVRKKLFKAKVCRLPFITPKTKRERRIASKVK